MVRSRPRPRSGAYYWLAVSLVLVSLAACGGFRSSGSPAAEPPGLPAAGAPAVMFAPGVVSTGDVFASTFTADGRTVIFTRFAAPRMALMQSTLVDGRWTEPVTLPFSGTYRDLDPALTPDDARLYFSSWRPSGTAPGDTTNGADTWYVDRRGSGWSAPVRLAAPVNSAEVDMYPSVTTRGVLYFDSFRSDSVRSIGVRSDGSPPRRRLVYRVEPRAGGGFAVPAALDATINADSGASNLFVDPDERYVVFAASRPEGAGGADLYLSWRLAGGGWTTPANLGPQVNTPGTEFCPFVSRDGRALYFTRLSQPVAGPVTRNVYVVRFDELRARLERSRR